MSNITHDQYQKLSAMGKAPINLPADIYFAGNITLQKSPGVHHRPEFRQTGTYYHPLLVAQREREAKDAAKRLIDGKMSEPEHRKIGGLKGLQEKLAEHGLTLTSEQGEVAKMYDDSLSLTGEMKVKERELQHAAIESVTGKKYEPIVQEPAHIKDDILQAAMSAAKAMVKGDDDLSSLRSEDEKDSGFPGSGIDLD